MTLRRTQPLAVGHLISPMVIANFINLLSRVLSRLKVAGRFAMSPLRTKLGAL
jgi:hypothetical protein